MEDKKTPAVKPDQYVSLAKDAYDASTSYIDDNYRKQWDYALKAFNSEHMSGSKYLHPSYKYRSKLYRPKTRSAIRRSEAAGVAAFFGNLDLVDVKPQNETNELQEVSAQVNHYILNHRLEHTIPWYLTCIGALQDAITMGVVSSYQYWDYRQRQSDGKVIADKPVIDLRPIENIRIDSAASWMDPVGTTPYLIDLIPMYVQDITDMMRMTDPKTGQPKWINYTEDQIASVGMEEVNDQTKQSRMNRRTDPHEQRDKLRPFDTIFVHRNIINQHGDDIVYYTLGTQHLLTEPRYLDEVYHHGERPYVMGQTQIETHKVYPGGVPELTKNLQSEANEISNSRLDNVKLAINKRYFVKRGREVDVSSLVRNAAASVTLMTDVDGDVRVVETNDVTGSSYAEQDRLNLDFDDIAGNFSPGSVQSNRKLNETVGGMNLLKGDSSTMTGYSLKTFAETWVQPVLRQVVKLEQAYETDMTIIALAAEKAEVYQRYGVNADMDRLLSQDLTVAVDIGMTATDPLVRLQQLIQVASAFSEIAAANPGFDLKALADEMFGRIGYRGAAKFMKLEDEQDPQVTELQQMVAQLQQELKMQLGKVQAEGNIKMQLARFDEENENKRVLAENEYKEKVEAMDNEVKLAIAKMDNQTKLAVEQIKTQDKQRDRLASTLSERDKMAREDKRESEGDDKSDKLKQDMAALQSDLNAEDARKQKARQAIIGYLNKNGNEEIKKLVDKLNVEEQSNERSESTAGQS